MTSQSPLSASAVRRRTAATLLTLLLLAGTLFFFRLGTPGLFDADEPAYAQAAREMVETGDWITPHFNGRPRFDKPILFYWLISLSYRVFGVTEFAVRFWSALAAVVLVGVVAWTAGRWLGPPADLWAGLAFTTNLLTAVLARAAVTDMLLTLFVTLAILAGLEALGGPSPSREGRDPPKAAGVGWAVLAWGAVGLAVLVKGPVGLLIPAMALGGTLVVLREVGGGLRRLVPWQGAALFGAITFPWYALVLAANGWAFVEGFVIKHHLTRYTEVVSSHAGPIWFYLPVVLIGFFPWSGFLPRAVWQAGLVARRREVRWPADRLLIASACWVIGVFLFFSLARTKLPSYLFPAFPGLALLVGASAISNSKPTTDNRSIEVGPTDGRLSVVGCQFSIGVDPVPTWLARVAPWLIGLTGGALALGFGMLPVILEVARPRAGGILDGVAAPVGLAGWLAGLLALGTTGALLARGPWRPAFLSGMMGLLIFTAGAVAPQVYAILQGSLREFAEDARRILGGRGTLVAYGLNAPTIVFYAGRPVTPLGAASADGVDRLRRLLEAGHPVVVITRSVHAPRLDGLPGLFRLKSRGGYAIYCSACQAERNSKLKTDLPVRGRTQTGN
ncbi:MAG: glycosyltransferase family 39 protein [candidate division NC10 bacterium]|nr:glycosyltransferase family 39 protein [candidate division NC10 bacterium]